MKKFRERIKYFLKNKQVKQVAVTTVVLSALCVGAFAVDETPGVGSAIAAAFQTGFQTVITDSMAMLAAMVPIAVGFAGALFIVKKAMTWFKAVAK